MAFGNTNNNNSTFKGTNTRSTQFYNQDGSKSTMVLGYWSTGGMSSTEYLTIKIHPQLPENERTQNAVYDYKQYVSVTLTVQRALELLEACKEIEKYIENGSYDFVNMGVPSKESYLDLKSATSLGAKEDGIALEIFAGVDATGNATQSLFYIFNKGKYLTGYKGDGSEFGEGTPFESEFKIFKITLEEFIKAATYAQAHINRSINHYQTDFVRNSLHEIKNKLGIQNMNFNNNNVGASTTTYYNSRMQDNNSNQNVGTIENGGTVYTNSLPM